MKRLPMRKMRESLWFRSVGFSGRRVAQSLLLGRANIAEYFRRADVEGLSWPLPPLGRSDASLGRANDVHHALIDSVNRLLTAQSALRGS